MSNANQTAITPVPVVAVGPAGLPAEVDRAARRVKALMETDDKAPNTRKAYAHALVAFEGFCASLGLQSVPAEPETVATYVGVMMEQGRKAATITLALAAIADAHRSKKLESPTRGAEVRHLLRKVRVELGTSPKKKKALCIEEIRALVATLDDSAAGLRDRALLLFGFAGAFRRSEIVGLDVSDVAQTKDGMLVTVRNSKTDKRGAGQDVAIPYGTTPATCPVRALRAWLDAAGITSGPLFRGVNRHGQVAADRLSDRAVAEIVKRTCKAAGLDSADFAGHSLRSGLITTAANAGKPIDVIMRQSRHKTLAVALDYIQSADRFKHNAASGIGL